MKELLAETRIIEWAITIITAIGLWISPAVQHFIIIAVFVFIDFITAIIAARKNLVAIESKLMKHTIYKWIIYELAILITLIYYHVFDIKFMIYAVSIFICTIELKSIQENFLKINSKFNINFLLDFLDRSKNKD